MVTAIVYIGFAQSLFAAILVLQKKPLSVADKILAVLLFVIGVLFFINIVEIFYNIPATLWPFTLGFTITVPTLLYLYSKYTINEDSQFQMKEALAVLLPPIIIFLLLFIFIDKQFNGFVEFAEHLGKLILLRNCAGAFFVINLWVSCILTLKNIKTHRKQIDDLYSYKSDKISLSWLQILTIALLVVYNLTIVVTAFENSRIFDDIEIIRKIILLGFVYIISIWGYKQVQFDTTSKQILLNENLDLSKSTISDKYQKCRIKEEQATQYLNRIIQYMNNSEIWKDNELSIAKLSQYTEIPKHYITQILNENLNKNFYTFVNEYRIEHAKKLIKSSECKAWSIIAIAFECGFNSKTAFNNFFKKYTGMTPSEFRKNKDELLKSRIN
jgi:AraC-like DNA-binding protein